MKQFTLSIEQMKHLKELGLDTSDASLSWLETFYTDGTKKFDINWEDDKYNFDWETCYPAYTLQDILEKLPNRIHYINGIYEWDYTRMISDTSIYYEDIENYPDSEALVGFEYASKEENPYNSGSMINAFYDMLVWCLENNYIKIIDK